MSSDWHKKYNEPLIKRDILVDRVSAAKHLLELEKYKYAGVTRDVTRQNEIDVYLKDKLVGSLSTVNIELENRTDIVLTYVEDSASIIARNIISGTPTKPKHIILKIGVKSFEIDRVEFERMKIHESPWPPNVPRYAEYIIMPVDQSLRFRWKCLQVSEEAYEELFDFDEFTPA